MLYFFFNQSKDEVHVESQVKIDRFTDRYGI